jgi:iron complex outermembrane receptor protein
MPATTRIALKTLALSASALAFAHTAPAMAQVEEIIVTAQKVEENVQDVPIAVSVLTPDRLDQTGTISLETLNRIIPSVTFRRGTTAANSAILMRGVGTISFSIAAEPSVSTVFDGVVLSRPGQSLVDLADIERIEVLRGPQGTLFGKNASAGLINIVSKGGTDTLEAEARAEWFEGDEYRMRASVSGPLGDGLSARLTGVYASYDGNITNIFGGRREQVNGYERYGVRGVVDYETDTARIRFIADWFRNDDDCCADITAVSRGAAIDSELNLPGGAAQGEDQRFVNHNLVSQTLGRQWSATLSGEFDISETHTLSAVAGYRKWRNRELREGDFLPRPLVGTPQIHDDGQDETQQYSLEVRLASDQSKPFFYQVGAFAWHSDNTNAFTRRNIACSSSTTPATAGGAVPCNLTDTVNTIFPFATSASDVNSTSYAVFGQATWQVSDLIALTGGLRYTRDELDYIHTRAPAVNALTGLPATSTALSGNPAGGTIVAGGNGTNTSEGATDNDNLSGRAILQITPSEDVMLYASYTRGYKGPAFNVFFNHTRPTNSVAIDEETSDAFEAGIKSQFLDNRVQANLAAFTVTYDGFQANNFVLLNGGIITNLTNAGKVRSQGFEADVTIAPVDGLTLRANAAYADAKVVEFNPNPLTNAPDARNGTRLPLAPEFTYMLGADYETGVGSDVKLYLSTDYRHTSSQFSDLGQQGPLEGYGLLNASIGISDAEDKYRLTFHVNNIFDESYVLLNVSAGQRLQIPRDADRFVGVSLRVRTY